MFTYKFNISGNICQETDVQLNARPAKNYIFIMNYVNSCKISYFVTQLFELQPSENLNYVALLKALENWLLNLIKGFKFKQLQPSNYNYQLAKKIIKETKMYIEEFRLDSQAYLSGNEKQVYSPKKSICISQTTVDSPLMKPRSLASQTFTQDTEDEIFDSKCKKYHEDGFCAQGKNCIYQHQTKNLEQIIGNKRNKKRMLMCSQFAELLIIRNTRTTSFFF